jgi:hypothetical protein
VARKEFVVGMNRKRVVTLWGIIVISFAMLSLGYGVSQGVTLPQVSATDITVVDRELLFGTKFFNQSWTTEIALPDDPAYFSTGISLPFRMRFESVGTSGEVYMEVTVTVNSVSFLLSQIGIEVIPGNPYGPGGLHGDLTLSRTLDAKLKEAGPRPGLNRVSTSILIALPAGPGLVEVLAGPMTVEAHPIDTSGDGLPEVYQIVKGVNYYGFTAALAFAALVLASAFDALLQRWLDRRNKTAV